MESLYILVIAVTGFIYVNLNLVTRYRFKRSQDWSAYLYVAAWGIVFFISSWLIANILNNTGFFRYIYNTYINKYISTTNIISLLIDNDSIEEKKKLLRIFFIFILSLFLSLIFGLISKLHYNFIFSEDKLKKLTKIIKSNSFESLIFESYIRSIPLLITLSSNKVYVGMIPFSPRLEDGKLEYLSLLPLLSGYRENETLQVKLTINYYDHYEKFVFDKDSHLTLTDFNIAFPISEIYSLSFFDMETYNRFQENNKTHKQYFRKGKN